MSYNQLLMKRMGNIAANRDGRKLNDVLDDYHKSILTSFTKKSLDSSNINTLMHILAYFKDNLSPKENGRRFFKFLS